MPGTELKALPTLVSTVLACCLQGGHSQEAGLTQALWRGHGHLQWNLAYGDKCLPLVILSMSCSVTISTLNLLNLALYFFVDVRNNTHICQMSRITYLWGNLLYQRKLSFMILIDDSMLPFIKMSLYPLAIYNKVYFLTSFPMCRIINYLSCPNIMVEIILQYILF